MNKNEKLLISDKCQVNALSSVDLKHLLEFVHCINVNENFSINSHMAVNFCIQIHFIQI